MTKQEKNNCEFLNKESCHCRGYYKDDGLHIHLYCKDNPNCYYKQLQQLKEKIKKIKSACSLVPAIDSEELARDILKIIGEENDKK